MESRTARRAIHGSIAAGKSIREQQDLAPQQREEPLRVGHEVDPRPGAVQFRDGQPDQRGRDADDEARGEHQRGAETPIVGTAGERVGGEQEHGHHEQQGPRAVNDPLPDERERVLVSGKELN